MYAVHFFTPEEIRITVKYRVDYTIVSLLVVIILSYVGIRFCANDPAFTMDRVDTLDNFVTRASRFSIKEIRKMKSANYILFLALFQSLNKIIVGGAITALGVCIMHYLGMMAIVIDADIEWNPGIVAASVIIAVMAETAAYWILFRLLALYPEKEIFRLASAFIAALAVCGMHFTGMSAARYIYVKGKADRISQNVPLIYETQAFVGALIATVVFLFANLLVTTADLRAWYYYNDHIVRNTDKIISTMEITGGKNPVTYRAVKMYKVIRPEYVLQEKTDSFASSPSIALPILSIHGPEILARNPLAPVPENLGRNILGPVIDFESMSPSNSSKSGTSFKIKKNSSKFNVFMSNSLKVVPIEVEVFNTGSP
jgi:NO-binding membrane sensor protein with MHYT domain